MVRKTLIAATTVVAAVGALAWSSGGAGAAINTEAFHIVQDGNATSVTAHGVFNDSGTDIQKSQLDNLRLSSGGLTLYHPNADGTFTDKLNPATCVVRTTVSGSYTVGNGKRAYKGISGSGTYKGRGTDQLARKSDGSCDFNAEPVSQHFEVHASGPISFAAAS